MKKSRCRGGETFYRMFQTKQDDGRTEQAQLLVGQVPLPLPNAMRRLQWHPWMPSSRQEVSVAGNLHQRHRLCLRSAPSPSDSQGMPRWHLRTHGIVDWDLHWGINHRTFVLCCMIYRWPGLHTTWPLGSNSRRSKSTKKVDVAP